MSVQAVEGAQSVPGGPIPRYAIQVGWGIGRLGNCGTVGLVNFSETIVPGSTSESCQTWGAMTYQRSMKYSILKTTNGWQRFVDGVAKGALIPMPDADEIRAFGELSAGAGKNWGFFDQPGALPWQRHDGAAWVTIQQAQICNEDGYTSTPRCANGRWYFGTLTSWELSHGHR